MYPELVQSKYIFVLNTNGVWNLKHYSAKNVF